MSYHYKYKFVSPEPLYAEIREDLQSYFNTGIIDDVLFPKYTDYCLRKLGRVTNKITETALEIKNYQATLPEDFIAVREVYSCINIQKFVKNASSVYTQVTSQITPYLNACSDPCPLPDKIITVKTSGEFKFSYNLENLLHPGNINALEHCSSESDNLFINRDTSDYKSFDIRDNKILVNFKEGIIHLTYYKHDVDENENQLIPDVEELFDWIKSYIKYRCFESIFNKVTDETFNQVYQKYQIYQKEQGIKYVIAKTEFKKQNIYDVQRSIIKSYNRFNHYDKVLWKSNNYMNLYNKY